MVPGAASTGGRDELGAGPRRRTVEVLGSLGGAGNVGGAMDRGGRGGAVGREVGKVRGGRSVVSGAGGRASGGRVDGSVEGGDRVVEGRVGATVVAVLVVVVEVTGTGGAALPRATITRPTAVNARATPTPAARAVLDGPRGPGGQDGRGIGVVSSMPGSGMGTVSSCGSMFTGDSRVELGQEAL